MLPIATQNLIKMKKIIILLVVASIAVTACNSNNKSAETTATDNPNQLYACSMHPEVVGKKDSVCSKCGMKLTELVKIKK
jgi:Heavy metal binding domain